MLGAFIFLFLGVTAFGTAVNGSVTVIYGYHVNVKMLVFLFVPLYGAVLCQYRGEGKRADRP